MSRPSLKLNVRTATGKGPNRQSRAVGKIPAVVYTKGKPPVLVTAEPKAVVSILQSPLGRNSAIDLHVEGEGAPRLAIIKDYQLNPVKRTLEHIDFWEISAETPLTVTVPFAGEGKSQAEREGGRVRFTRDDIRVQAKPADVPVKVTFDMAALPSGDHNITISKIPMPKGVKAVFKHDYSLIQVFMAKAGLPGEGEGEGDKKAAAAKAAKAPAAKAPAAKAAAPAAKKK